MEVNKSSSKPEQNMESDLASKLNFAQTQIDEYNRLRYLRQTLRKQNLGRKTSNTPKNSSIKKVSSFLRKLKNISEHLEDIDALCEEASKLKLSKFLSEITNTISALNISRKKEMEAIIKVCSILHREYSDFSSILEDSVLSDIESRFEKLAEIKKTSQLEAELAPFIKRQRRNLRLLAELVFTGVIDDALLVDLLKSIVKRDKRKDKFFVVPVLMGHYMKYASEESTGRRPKEIEESLKTLKIENKSYASTLDQTSFAELKNVLLQFFAKCSSRLSAFATIKKTTEQKLVGILKQQGGLTDKMLENLKEINMAFNRLFLIVDSMAGSLNEDLEIEYSEAAAFEDADEILVRLKSVIALDKTESLFEDEESRKFYEDLPDLSIYIAPRVEGEEQLEEQTSCSEGELLERFERVVGSDWSLEKFKFKSTGFESLLKDLENANSKLKIDGIAERYCLCNCEHNRFRLIDKLLNVKKSQQNLILYYSRLIATLSKYFKELKRGVLVILEKRFNEMFFRKKKLSARLINITFIAELTKFEVFPPNVVFKMLQKCFDHRFADNVYVACSLLETSGRWLYKNPLTHQMSKQTLSAMEKTISSRKLDESLKKLMQMTIYQCNPPPIKCNKTEKLPPEQAFIRFILFRYLNEKNVDRSLRLLRKLDWNNGETANFIRSSLLSIVNLPFAKLHLFASMVAVLNPYYGIGYSILDAVLEEIRYGLEHELFFLVQRRIAFINFLGELFIYRLANIEIIFDTLYLLITFGRNEPETEANKEYYSGKEFRIKLVCALLKICGRYFRRNWARKKLNRFLLYLQRYVVLTKLSTRLTAETECLFEEIFDELFPNKKILTDLEEINERLRRFDEQSTGSKAPEDAFILKDEWNEDCASNQTTLNGENQSDGEYQTTEHEKIETKSEYDEDYSDGENWNRKHEKNEADILFEKEYVKFLKDSVDNVKYEKKSINIHDSHFYVREGVMKGSAPRSPLNKNTFCFLTKAKGENKPIAKTLAFREKEEHPFTIKEEDDKKKNVERRNLLNNVIKMEKRILEDEES